MFTKQQLKAINNSQTTNQGSKGKYRKCQVKKKNRYKKFDAKSLMAEAEAITGLSDYGNLSLQPFEYYLEINFQEVTFHPDRIDSFRTEMLRLLVNRLRIQNDLKQYPEILEEDVSCPIIITGLSRSGTTKLQRLISSAPDVQKLYLWRMLNPAPFPNTDPNQPDPRITAAGLSEGVTGESVETNEALQAAHLQAALEPDEEVFLFDFTLDQSICDLGGYVPLLMHQDWSEGSPERQADFDGYRYLRTLLQYLQWQDGGRRNRPWVMKTPTHTAHY